MEIGRESECFSSKNERFFGMMGEYGLENEGEYVSSKLWVWKCNKSYVENSTKLKSDHVIYSLLKEEKKYLLTECSQMRKHTHKHKKRIHIAPKHSSYVYIITRVVQFMCTYFCRHTYTFMFTRVQQLLGRINSQPSEKRNGWTECTFFLRIQKLTNSIRKFFNESFSCDVRRLWIVMQRAAGITGAEI